VRGVSRLRKRSWGRRDRTPGGASGVQQPVGRDHPPGGGGPYADVRRRSASTPACE
jgi:hypothetical protein